MSYSMYGKKAECQDCGETRVEMFPTYKDKHGDTRYKKKFCKKCTNKRRQLNKDIQYGSSDNRREAVRRSYYKTTYGLTVEEIEQTLLEQDYSCAICSTHITFNSKAVDHDHFTGEVRELLCSTCNQMLGFAKDSPEILDKAAEYLRKWGG